MIRRIESRGGILLVVLLTLSILYYVFFMTSFRREYLPVLNVNEGHLSTNTDYNKDGRVSKDNSNKGHKKPSSTDDEIQPSINYDKEDALPQESSTKGQVKQPHILLIVTDDQGYNGVGYNGNTQIKTPVIDKLAKTGVILDNYYVQRVCTPTRGMLFSGRHSINTGLDRVIRPGIRTGLPLDNPTIADKLKEAGYSTNLVGKWHIGYYTDTYLPTRRGFDSFFGVLNGHSDHFTYINDGRYGGDGDKWWTGYDLYDGDAPVDMDIYNGTYSTTLFSEKAIQIVKEHAASKPLFLAVTFTAPHSPIQAPQRCIDIYGDTFGNDTAQARYAGMHYCLDEAIGKITDAFKCKGMWDDTVMIYTSDNGATSRHKNANYPLKGHKGYLYEGGIKVPGFVHSNLLKDRVKGTISKELLHVSDWFPTLAGLGRANLNNTKALYGYDVRKTIFEGDVSPRKEILHDLNVWKVMEGDRKFNNTFDTRIRAGLRVGNWKILTGPLMDTERSVRLYNIEEDPTENNDLADTHPDVLKEMLDRLEYHRNTMGPGLEYTFDKRANPFYHNGFWGPWM